MFAFGTGHGSVAGAESDFVEAPFRVSTKEIINPERGFYVQTGSRKRLTPIRKTKLDAVRRDGVTLVLKMFYLDEFRDRPLSQPALDIIDGDFNAARLAGVKLIPRFAYGSRIGQPDAKPEQVERHLEQLAPILRDHSDVLFTMQAGFAGPWGEWHNSTNNLTSPENGKRIVDRLLSILPPSRTVQIRTPALKQNILGKRDPLAAEAAFDGTNAARLGHHNDCFLADATDVGTYRKRRLEEDRRYVASESRFVPVGGETCRSGSRSDPQAALDEFARMHWTFLNRGYHRGVLAKWRQEGILPVIRDRLGYRLALRSARLQTQARAGSVLTGSLVIENLGWAAPVNPREVVLSLNAEDGATAVRHTVKTDPRRWLPGRLHEAPFEIPLPNTLNAGQYRLLLSLPDPSPRLRDDPRYMIRLANEAIVAEDGSHLIFSPLRIN